MIDFELLDYIIDGIESGKLKYNQAIWHCGTAHCIAGWVAVLKAPKFGFYYNPKTELFYCIKKKFNPANLPSFLDDKIKDAATVKWYLSYPPNFSREILGLTQEQADCIFSGRNTLEDIKMFRNQFWEEENSVSDLKVET